MVINSNNMTVTLPARNESHDIGNFLKSVPESLKLIIADAYEDSAPVIVSYPRPDYTTLTGYRDTETEARQTGAKPAATTWLLFTDADTLSSEVYFRNLAHELSLDYLHTGIIKSTRQWLPPRPARTVLRAQRYTKNPEQSNLSLTTTDMLRSHRA